MLYQFMQFHFLVYPILIHPMQSINVELQLHNSQDFGTAVWKIMGAEFPTSWRLQIDNG